jgi:hypothetical protein
MPVINMQEGDAGQAAFLSRPAPVDKALWLARHGTFIWAASEGFAGFAFVVAASIGLRSLRLGLH